jgi:hypothetical protein
MTDTAQVLDPGVLWELLANEENLAANTYYYPSETGGQPMTGYDDLSIRYILAGGVTMTIEAMQDHTDAADPDWEDVTQAGYDVGTNDSGNAFYLDQTGILDFDNFNVTAFRVKIVTSDGTNSVRISSRSKSTDK